MSRPVALAVIVLALLAAPAPLYADGPVSAQVLEIDDGNFPDVRVVLTISDNTGRAFSGLATNAFTAEESGARAQVSKVELSEDQSRGVGVVLTIDTSASMRGAPLTQASASAKSFVQSLQPSDEAGVVSFASKVTVQTPLTSDRGQALAAFDQLVGFGDTALYDAVSSSVDLATTSAKPRKAVIFLSDGGIGVEVSSKSRDESLQKAAGAGIPFYTIGLGGEVDRNYMRELAQRTGGAYLEAPSAADIPALYSQLSQLLKAEYIVTLKSAARPDLANRNLSMTITTPAGVAQVVTDYKSRRTIVPPTEVVVPPVAQVSEPSKKSNTPVYAGLGILVALAGAATFLAVYRWRNNRAVTAEIAEMTERAGTHPAAPLAAPARPEPGVALVVHGPTGEARFEVRQTPLTIGRGETCQIRLDNDGERVGEEQARVWANAGKLVFHQLAKTPSLVKGVAVTWASLDPGSEIVIGAYRLKVEGEQAPA